MSFMLLTLISLINEESCYCFSRFLLLPSKNSSLTIYSFLIFFHPPHLFWVVNVEINPLRSHSLLFVYWFRNFCTPSLVLPNEAFLLQNPKVLGLSRQFGQIDFGVFGVFSANYQPAPILVKWVPCPCFPLINHYFKKN